MKTRLYLDTRHQKGDGSHPVKISLSVGGRTAYLGTGIDLPENEWSFPESQPRKAALAIKLSEKKLAVDKTIEELRREGRLHGKSVTEIKDIVKERLERNKANNTTVLSCFDGKIATLRRPGTLRVYQDTRKKLITYPCFKSWYTFEEITAEWMKKFDDYLAKSAPSANARAIHLRNIRAVFNWAIANGCTKAHYPFRDFKIQSEPTRDRSLSVDELREYIGADCTTSQRRYRDIFLLSFLCCGINLEDLLSIRELKGGRIETTRIKTGQPLSIKVQPEAMALINKHRGKKYLLDVYDRCKSYRSFQHRLGDALKTIGTTYNPVSKKWEGEALQPDISYYWARYTWATLAAELDIPERTIGAALGHSTSKSVTSIYTRVDMRKKIDDANRKVIDHANLHIFEK